MAEEIKEEKKATEKKVVKEKVELYVPKNIRQKLQEARMLLKEENLSKSGVNGFLKVNYYTLQDILPAITKICNQVRICPVVTFDNFEQATMTIYDFDSEEKIVVNSPMTEIKVAEKKSAMQELLGTETYARRGLYLATFDIIEQDEEPVGNDLEMHEILMVKTRIEREMTELLKKGYDVADVISKCGLKNETQYNQFLNACNTINSIERVMKSMLQGNKE